MAKKATKKTAPKKAAAKKPAAKKVEAPVIEEAQGIPAPTPLAEEVVEAPVAVAPVKKTAPAKKAKPAGVNFIY